MERPAILVIDDEESITSNIAAVLRARGYQVTTVNDGEEALEVVARGEFPVILSDIYIDRMTGLDVLAKAKQSRADSAVILMTARGSVRTTVEAEMRGAFDYLAKPFEMRTLLEAIERAVAYLSQSGASAEPEEELQAFGNIIGFSPPMVEVYKKIARSARLEDTVLIVGESGVGKELVARAIHENSARAKGPFVPVDSGAVAESVWESEIFGSTRGAFTGADRDRAGVIETARGGTVFFDEIGEVPLGFQAKLLRLLQEKEFRPVGAGTPRKADVRMIAATNRPLETMVRDGKFREDLFYRLNVLRIEMPPLRERRPDIEFLVKRFLEGATQAARKRIWLEPEAGRLLEQYSWPGNVRQLQNTIQRLVAMTPPGPVSAEMLQPFLRDPMGEGPEEDAGTELSEVERRQILRVLAETGGNKTKAAEILGIQRRTLYKKLARLERERATQPDDPQR